MNWTRLSATESIAADYRGSQVARVWHTDAGWFGSMGGKQSDKYEFESDAQCWCEAAHEDRDSDGRGLRKRA